MKDTMLEIAKRVDAFFAGKSPVQTTMHRLAEILFTLKIPFVISGDMAANAHGHKQTTSRMEILMRRDDLNRFKERWIGFGVG